MKIAELLKKGEYDVLDSRSATKILSEIPISEDKKKKIITRILEGKLQLIKLRCSLIFKTCIGENLLLLPTNVQIEQYLTLSDAAFKEICKRMLFED